MIKLFNQFQLKLVSMNILCIVIFAACTKQAKTFHENSSDFIARAEITNANNFVLTQEPFYFSFYDLGLGTNDKRQESLGILQDGKPLSSQVIDQDGDGLADGIFTQIDFEPAQIKSLSINTGVKSPTSITFENKQIQADASSLKGLGFWNGNTIDLASQVSSHQVVTNNGDLYSAVKINYADWNINNQKVNLAAHIATNTASRLVHVQLTASEALPNLAVGLEKSPAINLIQGDTNIAGDAWTYVATWGKQGFTSPNGDAGVAVIFHRADRKEQVQDEHYYVSVLSDPAGRLEYYFVSTENKTFSSINTEAEFKIYLDHEVERLTKAPRIRFESSLSVNAKKNLDAETALKWAKALADSEVARKTLNYHLGGWDEYRKRLPKFEYDVVGMQIQALQDIDAVSPDERYKKALETVTGSYIQADGKISAYEPDLFSIDLIKPGQMVILLEQRTKNIKYRKAADYLRERLRLHPRTSEGAFWHRATYPNQLWLDGVYMGMPFLAQYANAYEAGEIQHKSFAEVVHEFVIARNHLRNPETGLYYHAWDESKKADWADKQTGRASQYWSRGMGWYAMALVDVLDFIPESETELRKTLINIVQEFAADILRYQDAETFTWWQITDKPHGLGNYRESSATAMFSYFLLKSVNKNYLPISYKDIAIKTYGGLINEFVTLHADGKISMNDQCLVAGLGFGRDGSYNYYLTETIVSNDPKGNSPFIFAGVEAYKLLKHN